MRFQARVSYTGSQLRGKSITISPEAGEMIRVEDKNGIVQLVNPVEVGSNTLSIGGNVASIRASPDDVYRILSGYTNGVCDERVPQRCPARHAGSVGKTKPPHRDGLTRLDKPAAIRVPDQSPVLADEYAVFGGAQVGIIPAAEVFGNSIGFPVHGDAVRLDRPANGARLDDHAGKVARPARDQRGVDRGVAAGRIIIKHGDHLSALL